MEFDPAASLEYLKWIDQIAGPVWLLLTIFLFRVLYLIVQKSGWRNKFFYLTVGLLVLIYLHPVYTSFYPSLDVVQAGNVITFFYGLFVYLQLRRFSPFVAQWLLPQLVWNTAAIFFTALKLSQHSL